MNHGRKNESKSVQREAMNRKESKETKRVCERENNSQFHRKNEKDTHTYGRRERKRKRNPTYVTECPKIYRTSVLHLFKYGFSVYLSRCSTDLR